METQPKVESLKQWPVRAVPPKVAQAAGADPPMPGVTAIQGGSVLAGIRWLLPTLFLTLASAYGLSALWAHTLIQSEAEVIAAVVRPELQRIPFSRILDPGQRERTDWRWQEELARLAVSLPRRPRVTVWDMHGRVIWSQDQSRPGGQSASSEVQQSLSGQVLARVIEGAYTPSSAPGETSRVLEVYVPLSVPEKSSVVGVIGLSQPVETLDARIYRGQLWIWAITLGGGFLLALGVVMAVIRTSKRYSGHVRSLQAQLTQRAKTVESTNRQLRETLETSERRANELNRLLAVAEAVGAAVTEEELYGTVAEAAARACGVDRCSILLRDPAGEFLIPVSRRFADEATGQPPEGAADAPASLSLDEVPPMILEVVQHQRPVVLSEPGGGQRASAAWLQLFPARSALIVPLVHQGKTAGVLSLEHLQEVRTFTQDQIQLATTLATQAAAALDKARLYQEIAQRLKQTETLLAVMRSLASTLDFTDAVRQTTREVAQALGADIGGVWCVTGRSDQFSPVAGYHVPPELLSAVSQSSVSMQDDIIKCLRRLAGPIYSASSQTDHRFDHPLTRLVPHKSLVLQPIQAGEELMGFLALAWVGERHLFKSDEISLLAGTGRQLAVAVELRRTQEHVSRQERLNALGQMASGIAHDFNNALVPVAGYTELLLSRPDQLQDKDRVLRYLRIILTGARDAASVVGRLREFYRRRETGEEFHAVDLNQLVEQVIALTRPKWRDEALARSCDIEVTAELQPIPSMFGNESELREMLTNLIFNAVDAMPKGGRITIRTLRILHGAETAGDPAADPPTQVSLEVSDTGIGMTADIRQRCLEPFFSTKGERGSGLGLAMVYGTVKRHRGTLDLDSSVGVGTKVAICFPAESAAEPEASTQSATPPRELDVLVVDDEPFARDVIAQYLVGDGHRVQLASNGREGLERFKAGRFDVVVTDQAMPIMNGGELAGLIKALAPSVPVILVTGFGDIMTASDNHPAGVDRILTKPASMAAVREAVANLTAHLGERG
jgi:signal transduction histidine kinase/ActR/RegA family two-component response regulator